MYMGIYLLGMLAALLAVIAQYRVNSTFDRYSVPANSRHLTGAQAASMLLQINGIMDVTVEHVDGTLTDHYNPAHKVLRLSDMVYDADSIAALGVAAHETGHAVQHAKGYVPLTVRSAIMPAVSFSSKLALPVFILGLIIGVFSNSYTVALAGAMLFGCVVLFQVITLPVEFDASHRALQMLSENNLLDGDEIVGARKVLSAAAMTYVAATAASIVQLLRLLAILASNRDD